MSRTTLLLVFLVSLLAACGGQPSAETATDGYPAPLEAGITSEPELQVDTSETGYPAPYPVNTPVITLGTAYPEPQIGIQTFRIVPGESKVTYEVGEVFLNQDNAFNLAVGITTDINGEILVDRENPQNSSISIVSVDISKFTSDNQRRDNAIRERFLQSAQYPIVQFSPQDIQGLPDSYEPGEVITFQVSGDLTIRDVTKPVTFDVKMSGIGDTITGEATTLILMSDYGFGPISIAGILNTEDEVNIKINFVAQP
jgi:polyisoprenoid-binding protein YceI